MEDYETRAYYTVFMGSVIAVLNNYLVLVLLVHKSKGEEGLDPVSSLVQSSPVSVTATQMCSFLEKISIRWYIRLGIFLATILTLASFLIQEGTGSYTLFTLHPILMISAFAGLLSEGVLHYRLSTATLENARIHHGVILILSTLLALIALIIILVNKVNIKHELYPHTAHAVCGTATLTLMAYQALSGCSKLQWLWKTGDKMYTCHGKLGIIVIYVLSIITMLLGFQEVEGGLSLWIASGSLIFLCVLVLHTFFRRKRTVIDPYAALTSEIELEMTADPDLDFSFS